MINSHSDTPVPAVRHSDTFNQSDEDQMNHVYQRLSLIIKTNGAKGLILENLGTNSKMDHPERFSQIRFLRNLNLSDFKDSTQLLTAAMHEVVKFI